MSAYMSGTTMSSKPSSSHALLVDPRADQRGPPRARVGDGRGRPHEGGGGRRRGAVRERRRREEVLVARPVELEAVHAVVVHELASDRELVHGDLNGSRLR